MNKISPWVSLLPLLLVYAEFVFVVSSLTVLTDSNAILYSYAVFYPVLMLSGAWAVLGPGSYAVRTICSIAVVLTIFLAGPLGIWMTSPEALSPAVIRLTVRPSPLICCYGIPLICTAQLPYWLGRLIFGWQLIDEAKQPKQKKINLKEMLTITTMLAVCVAALTQANLMLYDRITDRVEIGNIELVDVERARADAALTSYQFLFTGYMAFIALSTLVNIPCFYSGMNNENPIKAFYFAASYWLTLALILFFAILTIPDLSGGIFFALSHGIFLSLLFAGAAAIPMFVVRTNGGKLVGRDFFLNLSKDSQSPAPKRVVDPFDD